MIGCSWLWWLWGMIILVMLTFSQTTIDAKEEEESLNFIMATAPKGTKPRVNDQYCQYRMKVPQHAFGKVGIGYLPVPSANAHHLMLFRCTILDTKINDVNSILREQEMDPNYDPCKVLSQEGVDPCGEHMKSEIIMVWANGGEPFWYPNDVGLLFGPNEGETLYLGLTLHFASKSSSDSSGFKIVLQERPVGAQKFIPHVLLLIPGYFELAPKQPAPIKIPGSLCLRKDVQVFAVRVHAHTRGIENEFKVYRKSSTRGLRVTQRDLWNTCESSEDDPIVYSFTRSTQLPQSFIPLSEGFILLRKGDYISFSCSYDTSHTEKRTLNGFAHDDEMCNIYLQYKVWDENTEALKKTIKQLERKREQPWLRDHTENKLGKNLVLDQLWNLEANNAIQSLNKYQITGVGVGRRIIWVFHRGSRIWELNTFNADEILAPELKANPIMENVIVGLHPTSGKLIASLGSNLFHLPHSITEDPDGESLWVTDVGLHQVIQISIQDGKILRSFGEKFVPGSDKTHFCKPTHVAFSTNKEYFYVSDGYCNSRVVKFNYKTGEYVLEFTGNNGDFDVPHALSIRQSVRTSVCGKEGKDSIFVCDRENYRIQVFSEDGSFMTSFTTKNKVNGGRPYAITVSDSILDYSSSSSRLERRRRRITTTTNENDDLGGLPVIFTGLRFNTNQGMVGVLDESYSSHHPCSMKSTSSSSIPDKLEWIIEGSEYMTEPHMADFDSSTRDLYIAEMIDGQHKGKIYKYRYSI